MTPVILVTFAGRRKRMEILTQYVRQAMKDGIIDEWHVWDFTRSPADRAWVTDEFGPVRYMSPEAPYQFKGTVTPRSSFRTSAKIDHDLHIAIIPNDAPENCYEIVVGGWSNRQSVLRKVAPNDLNNPARNDSLIWFSSTPAVLSPGQPNQIALTIDSDGTPALQVNDVIIGKWPELTLSSGASVMVRGGWGASLELCDVTAPVRRFVGNLNEQTPYWQAYDYYARRLPQFTDALFLKCDDDVVYLDIDKLSEFIDFRRSNPKYFVVSANVVNNGVCAYWQQEGGSLPETLGHFERPPGGFGGTLWQSPERATELHDFFLAMEHKYLPLPTHVVEWKARHSINFISWLGKDLLHMALPKCDDELALTVELPTFLDRPSAIYSNFIVSHLSFGTQEKGLDLDRLIDGYDALMRTKLSL